MKEGTSWALIAILLAVTIARNAIWADDGRLWNDIIEKAPRKARGYNEYGLHVLEAGDPMKAIRLLGRSLELNRYQPQVYVNIGLAYEKLNLIDKAIAKRLVEGGLRGVNISIDSPIRKMHEKIRGVEGAFKATTKAVELFRRYKNKGKLTVRINTVVSRKYYQTLDALPDLTYKLGADGINREFYCVNLVENIVPRADLIFCRDCLAHLHYEDIGKVISNFKKSESTFLLTTTFANRKTNVDLIGRNIWRPLNLQIPPFNFPPPLQLLNENGTEAGGQFSDKCLGLWLLKDQPRQALPARCGPPPLSPQRQPRPTLLP